MKRPAFQFYPADWRKDIELKACSIAARGLWIELLCLAHECEPYGHLTVNGRAMTPAQMAGQVGVTPAQCKVLLQELLDNGVARQTQDGVIYSKRMAEDEDLRERRAAGGEAGKSHGSKGASHGAKGGRPKKETGDKKPPSEPPPSSSSSSSSSTSENTALPPSTAEGGGVDGVNGATEGFTPTPAGAVCKALRQAGVPDTNPGHPRLLALLDAGARPEEFLAFVASATDGTKGSPFAYLLGAVEGERKRAAKTSQELHHGAMPAAAGGDRKARQLATAAVLTGASPAPKPQPETIDVHARIVAP